MYALEVNNLVKDYGDYRGIFNFSFKIEKGKAYALVGTNGSGKTTTMRNLMGFLKPDEGVVKINGYNSWTDAAKIKELVGYVPGEINFPDVGTGESFLKLQISYLKDVDHERLNRLINLFKIDIKAPLRRMSKGMKQKMALVCCFMGDKEIYLLDEPSTGLDPVMRDSLVGLINEEKAKGKTIFMSSHIFIY